MNRPHCPPFLAFAGTPLRRHSELRPNANWMAAALEEPHHRIIAFMRGDPLISGNAPVYLSMSDLDGFRPGTETDQAPLVFLGADDDGYIYFAVDITPSDGDKDIVPFKEQGSFVNLRSGGFISGGLVACDRRPWTMASGLAPPPPMVRTVRRQNRCRRRRRQASVSALQSRAFPARRPGCHRAHS